jgi:O-succinylhomoserine sulfhydrylase
LAQWLDEQPCVEKVFYPGMESHDQHKLMLKQQTMAGGILSFRVKGGQNKAWDVMNETKIISITANLGDTKTTITHPATTTHSRLSDEEKLKTGITENLIRISVGLESINDIKKDLQRGL